MRRGAERLKLKAMKKEKGQAENKPDNIFINAKAMLLSSIGRLPTSLVVLLLLSSAMAALTGVLLVVHKAPSRHNEFMELRLAASENASTVNSKDLQGTWIYQTPTYAMSLTLIGDRFEWMIALGTITDAQFYARGNYRIVGDVMVLGIRPDLGTPYDPSRPWLKYLLIGMKDINARFSLSSNKLVWDVPSAEQATIVGESASIFTDRQDGHFEWVKAEE